MNQKRYCLFHKDPDGFFSAYFIHRLHPDAEFIPINYNDPEPVLEDGAEVWIVDFSWVGPKEHVTERLEALCARMKHVNVIDHHEGVEPALRAVTAKNFTLRYDITKSGTELCFDLWANLDAAARMTAVPKIPYAAELVGDYDMWRHQKEGYNPSKKIDVERMNAAVWLFNEKWGSPEFFQHIELVCYHNVGYEVALANGRIALQVAARHVDRAMERVVWIGLRSTAAPSLYIVPAINSAEYPNELATAIADRFPGVPFVAIFNLGKHGWKFSLRGRGGAVAVNEVAAFYRGNGHKNAAGFTVRDLSGIPFKEARPTAQEVADKIVRLIGKEGVERLLRAPNTLTLIIDYGDLKHLPPGPEAVGAFEILKQFMCDHDFREEGFIETYGKCLKCGKIDAK